MSTVVPFPGLEAAESRQELKQILSGQVVPVMAEGLPAVGDEPMALEHALRQIRIAAVCKRMASRGNPEAAQISADWLIQMIDRALGPVNPAPEPAPDDVGAMRP